MGASGWSYFCPYRENVREALQKLKDDTFKSKEYYDPYSRFAEGISFEEFLPKGIELTDDLKRIFRIEYEHILKAKEIIPSSIEALLLKNGESGTHSILDIKDIADTDDRNRSGRMSDDDLFTMFESTTPNKEQVTAKEGEIQVYRGRWLCTYVIVYENEQPGQLFFTGYSGD